MRGQFSPVVLILGTDPERVQGLRTLLRASGVMPAHARSAAMAVSLFTQIRIQAVLLAPGEELGELQPLREAMTLFGIAGFVLADVSPVPEWTPCSEAELPTVFHNLDVE